MTSWVRPGAKCVCIDDSPGKEDHHFAQAPSPVREHIFTISAVTHEFGYCAVQVEELPKLMHGVDDGLEYELWMGAWRFRPLVEPKSQEQDVALFAPLLSAKKLERV